MENLNKTFLDSLTDPCTLFVDFLRFLQSTQPTTAASSSGTSVPYAAALSVPSTSAATVVSAAATSIPPLQPSSQPSQPSAVPQPLQVEPSAELTYQVYRRYRSQHPGPTSNRSFLRWVELGGQDDELFRWPYHPPNRNAGSKSRRGNGRGRGSRGGRRQRRNGGGTVVNGGIHHNY
nr:ATP-dependent RNA helicase DHH1-like [Hydra vulgaris]